VPSLKGAYTMYYTDLVKAIRGESELVIKPQQSRDAGRISELARKSADEGARGRLFRTHWCGDGVGGGRRDGCTAG